MSISNIRTFIIAHPSEKGGYNKGGSGKSFGSIIAHPSEKGGYNQFNEFRNGMIIIAHPSEKI